MTKQELLEMAAKLQEQANSMPDVADKEAPTTESKPAGETSESTPDSAAKQEKEGGGDMNAEPESSAEKDPDTGRDINANDELEEKKNIEPQTNGKITDDVKQGPDVAFEEPASGTETLGVEGVLSANLDQRFATLTASYQQLAAEMDKMKIALSEILTRIDLVQEVTDKVTTVDHDTLLSESIKLLI